MSKITCSFCGVTVLKGGGCKTLLPGLKTITGNHQGICMDCLKTCNARMAVILRELRNSDVPVKLIKTGEKHV